MRTLYKNGSIVTLTHQKCQALMVEDGKIVKLFHDNCIDESHMQVVDLKGRTLMPAFIDSHSHLSGYAMGLLQVDLSSCQSIEDIQKTINDYLIHHQDEETIISCKGYHQENLKEKRHITKQELDEISCQRAIVVQHYTGHCGVMNSAALKILGIERETPSLPGGRIDFDKGFLEENAFVVYLQKIPMPSIEAIQKAYQKAQEHYAGYGITTVQDGMIVDALKGIYQRLIDDQTFFLDVVGYVGFDAVDFMTTFQKHRRQYDHHFKIGGYKMFLDGSPQNKTAWTMEPYTDGTYGYPTLSDQQIHNYLQQAIQENMQVLAHCNGDEAIEHYIQQYEQVHQQDIRPVIVHAQMLRKSQMKRVQELGMIPSFFLAHVYYFGDIHRKNLGERAQTISPLHTALQYGIPFTMHQDTPVIEPNMLETLWIAVDRQSQSGSILGKEERIDIKSAVKALTIQGAYQYFEEKTKGTLEVGKKADMILLSDNPLKVDKHHLRNIEVLETIKDGKVVYQSNRI